MAQWWCSAEVWCSDGTVVSTEFVADLRDDPVPTTSPTYARGCPFDCSSSICLIGPTLPGSSGTIPSLAIFNIAKPCTGMSGRDHASGAGERSSVFVSPVTCTHTHTHKHVRHQHTYITHPSKPCRTHTHTHAASENAAPEPPPLPASTSAPPLRYLEHSDGHLVGHFRLGCEPFSSSPGVHHRLSSGITTLGQALQEEGKGNGQHVHTQTHMHTNKTPTLPHFPPPPSPRCHKKHRRREEYASTAQRRGWRAPAGREGGRERGEMQGVGVDEEGGID